MIKIGRHAAKRSALAFKTIITKSMKLQIDPEIFKQYPDLKIGAIVIKNLNNNRRISSIESLLRGVCAQRMKELADKEVNDEAMIQVWNAAYGKFGVNPNKYAPSIAALLKRLKGGKEIPHISPLVDLYNYFSLKYMLPIGGEDLDWLCGDLKLKFTKGVEPFRPLGSIEVEQVKEGEVAYMDDGGVTCRYWNHRECERTKFTNKTVNAVIIIEDLAKIHMDQFGEIIREMQNAIIKYIGGQIEPYILTEENPEIDFGIQGRKNVDDSKVPQQEKAHFFEKQKGKNSDQQKEEQSASPHSDTQSRPKSQPQTDYSLHTEGAELLKSQLKTRLKEAFIKAFPDFQCPEANVEYPASPDHGDYSSNIAMHLAKELQMRPHDIAQKILENFDKGHLIDLIEIAGPGFLNFFLSQSVLQHELEKVLNEGQNYGASTVGDHRNVIVEYSSPNIAKPLGVHHLQTTIIGQSLYNILKKLGYNTISINHIGDWGTQFGKLICAFKKWGNREEVEKDPINELLKLYVKFHDEAEKQPELEDEGRKEFKDFEEGDRTNRELWEWFVAVSMEDVNKTYAKLGGIHFDHTLGESFYEDKMEEILKEGKSLGVFEVGDEGAYVMNFDDPNMPTVPVQKKDGTTLYITRDFATLRYRIRTWNPIKILNVVDIAQTMHFKQLYEGARRLGWYDPAIATHVWFGRMHMKDGSMSTRKGKVILLNELLAEGEKRALEIIESKNPELANKQEVAAKIGIGAIKYNVLSQNRTTDITFDWDKILSLEGNSGPYLQYTYARAKSILRKDTSDLASEAPVTDPIDTEKKTQDLIRLFPKYAEQIALAGKEYKPNILSNYLYELAQKFNAFYNSVPVLKTADEHTRAQRLKIVEAAAQILKSGLALLGVEVVEEM